MSFVTFPCREFNDSETEANGSCYCGFAEEVDFSPSRIRDDQRPRVEVIMPVPSLCIVLEGNFVDLRK